MIQHGELSWYCEVCHELRLDEWISVVVRRYRLQAPAGATFGRNVRYCNDRQSCLRGAVSMHDALSEKHDVLGAPAAPPLPASDPLYWREHTVMPGVHILHEGHSLCGLIPGHNWPDGHTWVHEAHRGSANCSRCLACVMEPG